MKLSRKFVTAVALLAVSAVLMTTATLAWFSMNSRVTATGMQMTTEAGDNVLIAAKNTTAQEADLTKFLPSLVSNAAATNLRPVSTVNGANFYYVKGLQVSGSGAASVPAGVDPYVAYDSTNLAAFKNNYRTTDDVKGYVEFAFQVMATNAEGTTAKDLIIDTLDLTYSGAPATQKAFRVAVFADEFDTNGSVSTETLVTILRPSGATYTTPNKAVSGVNAKDDIPMLDKATTIAAAVPAGETKFYRIVLRVWLEGEDTTCTNKVFAALDETWSLDLGISFAGDSRVAKTQLNTQARSIELAPGYTIGTAAQPVGTTLYYPIMNGDAPIAVEGMANAYLYTTTAEGTVADATDFYALTKDLTYGTYNYPVNVTPQYKVLAAVDLTGATVTEESAANKVIGDVTYYAIDGVTMNDDQLYTTVTELASDSVIYTIDGDVATDVTVYCKLPTAVYQ